MRETVQAFKKRTGGEYAPPTWLTERYRPLKPRDALPTLFRYPGPCGLREHFHSSLARLGPPDQSTLWMAEKLLWSDTQGAAHFGTVALLQPLKFAACKSPRKGVFVGVNEEVDAELIAWVPPSFLEKRLPWDKLQSAREVASELGPRAEAERALVIRQLNAYLEELSMLEQSGATPTHKPWCEVPKKARLKLMAEFGIKPRWSK